MKIRSVRRRGQSGAEYMVLLGVVVLVTVWALNNLLPKIVKDCAPGDSSGNASTSDDSCGYATRLLSNVVLKITGPSPGSSTNTTGIGLGNT